MRPAVVVTAAAALVVAGTALTAVGLGVGTAPASAPAPPLSAAPVSVAPVRDVTVGPVLARSLPVRLDIPAIGVRTPVLELGRDAEGSVAMPGPGRDYDKAGWYRHSPTPGALGPAVLAGHVDSAATGRSVFYRLGALKPGDDIRVERADGVTARFTVDTVRRFEKSAFPTALVYGNTNHAALRLITCGGPLDRTSGHYRDNVVVTASLVSAE